MAKRKKHNGDEQDAFTPWRQVMHWQRGELRKIKRRSAKRDRRDIKIILKNGPDTWGARKVKILQRSAFRLDIWFPGGKRNCQSRRRYLVMKLSYIRGGGGGSA